MRIENRRQAVAALPGLGASPVPEHPPGGAPADPVSRTVRTAGLVLLGLYLCLMGWLALRPATTAWAYDTNLTPFGSVDRAFETGGLAGLRRLADGLLPLAPLGVLLPLAGGRLRTAWLSSWAQVVGATVVIATALEFVETSWAGRVLNVDDMLLPALGAGAVHLVLVPAGRALLRARLARERTPVGAPVDLPSPPAAAPMRPLVRHPDVQHPDVRHPDVRPATTPSAVQLRPAVDPRPLSAVKAGRS
ncbi:hypothetical protein P3T36_004437 [Kitasatospora sp. MAP12-15]|uniref:VanZ family protein n=1 Tax=unclassified Kitasatospora TaxID=2633591 RepID=UPI0024730B2B|nr:VanZ family protein [Kitasatospora sp. MAP12-44]MDH6110863.1 hypothetical protein [Kitasatospora sp. MAP12-44]